MTSDGGIVDVSICADVNSRPMLVCSDLDICEGDGTMQVRPQVMDDRSGSMQEASVAVTRATVRHAG